MRYRPWSSVTTIFANLVGRSVVSAITHTPASGPPAPLTVPPRSAWPTVIPGGELGCWADTLENGAAADAAMPIAAALRQSLPLIVIVRAPPVVRNARIA